ncbi:MAG: hypothetical protein JSS61_04840 [Verrucomicrobia bacterium]|nr:hypothetical protein [Verrucomicrobiota bacterium]
MHIRGKPGLIFTKTLRVGAIIFTRICILLLLLSSCSKHQQYFSVAQEWIDVRHLASTHVGTPDPRQENPPIGQSLIISWLIPSDFLKKKPEVVLDLILWDYTTRTIRYPVKRRLDYVTYKLLNKDYHDTQGIMTYKARLVAEDGEVLDEWKHQLWVNLITLDEEEGP